MASGRCHVRVHKLPGAGEVQQHSTRVKCTINLITHIAHWQQQPRSTLAGGTRFIGVYLARQLVEAGHEVTLYTRGKKPVTYKIADDTEDGYYKFARSVKHIAGDRQVNASSSLMNLSQNANVFC